MSWNSKAIIYDNTLLAPVPQFYNPTTDEYEVNQGKNGSPYTIPNGKNSLVANVDVAYQEGLANPSTALALTTNTVSTSSFTAETIYVAIDFGGALGRTSLGSSLSSIAVAQAGNDILFSIPMPTLASDAGIYVGTTSTPLMLGKISSTGQINYSGTSTTGLAVTLAGTTLQVTLSAVASATGNSPQATNESVTQPSTVKTASVEIPTFPQKDAKYLVSVNNPLALGTSINVALQNGMFFGGTTPVYSTVTSFNVASGAVQSYVVEGWLLGDSASQISVSNDDALSVAGGDLQFEITSI